ncbi:MAG: ribonuclease P protein component [Candidatus Peribacteraceae bacterium]|nr:ribonuclease P protein component [Candidatus Peribacteraceae bacterium]
MFTNKFRLRKKEEVDLVFRSGKTVAIPGLAFRFLKNSLAHPRIAVIVGKKLSPRAVDRNRIRRRLREIARNHLEQIPSDIDLLVIARDLKLREIDFAELTRKFLELLSKIN